MGVVVLNLHQRQGFPAAPRLGVGSGEIVRMEVADQLRHLDAKQTLKVGDLSLIVGQGLGIFQVADVLAQEEGPALRQGKRGFLFCAAGQNPGTVRL